jgi:hypothetical protein
MSNVNLNETAPTRRRHAEIFARGDANRQSSEQQRAGMHWTCSFRRADELRGGRGLAQAHRRAKAGPRTGSEALGRRGPARRSC